MRRYDRVKWMVVLLPVLFVILFQIFRRWFLLLDFAPPMVLDLLLFFVLLTAAVFFTYYAFYSVDSLNRNLSREQETMKAVFNHASDAIIIIDEDRRISAMNPAAEQLSGFGAEETVDRLTCDAVFGCRAGDDGLLVPNQCCTALFDTKKTSSYAEFSIRNRQGDIIPVASSCSQLPALEGKARLAVIIRDMRERQRLERERARRQAEAQTLYQLGQQTTSIVGLEKNMSRALDLIRALLESDVVGWAVYDERRSQRLHWKGFIGLDRTSVEQEGLFEFALEQGTARFDDARDLPDPERRFIEACGLESGAAVPLIVQERPVGMLFTANRAPRVLGDDHLRLLATVANQLAASLENVRLYNRVQDTAIMEERERIAREMHDGMAQALTYLNIQLTTVLRRLRQGKLEEVEDELEEMRHLVNEAYGDARQAIYDLKVRLSPEMDFIPTLGELLKEFSIANQLDVVLERNGVDELILDNTVEIQLVRIIQEALANVRKHAQASTVTVEVLLQDSTLYLGVRDDGQGFSTAPEDGPRRRFGLSIMRERAESVGGALRVESSPGDGTLVEVEIPLASRGGLLRNEAHQDIASG